MLVTGVPHAEVNVGAGDLGVATVPDEPDDVPFRDGVSLPCGYDPEVRDRDRVPVVRQHGHGPAVAGHRAREGHRSGRGRDDPLSVFTRHVDSSVLPAGVRIVSEDERPEDVAGHGPGPSERSGRRGEAAHADGERDERPTRVRHVVVRIDNIEGHCRRTSTSCQTWLQRRAVELVSGGAREARDDLGGEPPRQTRGDELGDGCDGGWVDGRRSPEGGRDDDRDLSPHPRLES